MCKNEFTESRNRPKKTEVDQYQTQKTMGDWRQTNKKIEEHNLRGQITASSCAHEHRAHLPSLVEQMRRRARHGWLHAVRFVAFVFSGSFRRTWLLWWVDCFLEVEKQKRRRGDFIILLWLAYLLWSLYCLLFPLYSITVEIGHFILFFLY